MHFIRTHNRRIRYISIITMFTLVTLPVELVYRVLDQLPDFDLFCSMQNVCHRLNQILETYHRYQVSLNSFIK